MKWITAPFVLVLAGVLATVVLWRMTTGRRTTLRGRWSPRVLRLVATLVVVVVGVGATASDARAGEGDRRGRRGDDDPSPATDPAATADDRLPETVTEAAIAVWRQRTGRIRSDLIPTIARQLGRLESGAALEAKEIERLRALGGACGKELGALLLGHIDATLAGEPLPVVSEATLLGAIAASELRGLIDPWMSAYLWRRCARLEDGADVPRVLARLEVNARVAAVLIRANAKVAVPYNARAWMSKAGPRREDRIREAEAGAAMLVAARELFASTDAGTLAREATVSLRVADAGAGITIRRGGRVITPAAGDVIRLGRLDAIEVAPGAPAAVEHIWLGDLILPTGRTLSVFDLPDVLPDATAARIDDAVTRALDDDIDAADRLELVLPFAHRAIEAGLRERPDAPGAARLRSVLAVFDEQVVRESAPPGQRR